MLERGYMLPVIIGLCLGLILSGVQISATALSAAVGQQYDIRLMTVESVSENGVSMRVLGREMDVALSLPDITDMTGTGLPDTVREAYNRCCEWICPAGRAR